MARTKERKQRHPVSKRFEFLEPIGTGGMGTVYCARDRDSGDFVAIKVMRESLSENPTLHRRLAREFKAAHELDHPNIVRALALENDGTTSYVVFELVKGCSLGDHIEAQGRIPEPEAVRIITQVAQALHYAHQRQVVHRDVKPDNILMLSDGRVKLTDFGLAKDFSQIDDECLTRAASGLGTPHFMAPEQFADARGAGPLCDVYSLGATLYNMLTGLLPFDAKLPVAILAKKEMAAIDPVRSVAPEASAHIEATIRAAVDPDPAKRPDTCLTFFRMLASPRQTRQFLLNTPLPPRSRDVDGPNRRKGMRFPVVFGTIGVMDNGVSEELWPIQLQDLSQAGVGILMARRFEPGCELLIELPKEIGKKAVRFPVKVVRVQKDRNGHWMHGCTFASTLTDKDVTLLRRML